MVRSLGGLRSSAASVSDSCEPLGRVDTIPHQARLTNLRSPRGLATSVAAVGSQVALPDLWVSYEIRLPASLRQDIRRSRVTIHTYRGREAIEALDVLVDLHRQRWRQRGLPGAFTAQRVQFHRRFLASGGPGRILVASQDGQAKGAIYLLEGKERWCYYQGGIRAERGSHGTALIAEAIRQTIDAGVPLFDFLRGAEPYKRRWQAEPYPFWKPNSAVDRIRKPMERWVRSQLEERWSRSVG